MPLAPKPPACTGCPAETCGRGFVPPQIPRSRSPLVLLGNGPSEQDAYTSRPFNEIADTGGMLTQWLQKIGQSRNELWIGNVVQCWLPHAKGSKGYYGNREPTMGEMKFCWQAHVGPALAEADPDWIVSIGGNVSKFLLGIPLKKSVEKFIGTYNPKEIEYVGDERAKPRTDGTTPSIRGETSGSGAETGTLRGGGPQLPVHHRTDGVDDPQPRVAPGRDSFRPAPRESELSPLPPAEQPGSSPVRIVRQNDEGEPIVDAHGSPRRTSGRPVWLMPLVHPAAIMRGQWKLETPQREYLKRALGYAKSGSAPPYEDFSQPPPGTVLYPRLEEWPAFIEEVKKLGGVSYDIESVGMHLLMIGFTSLDVDSGQIGRTFTMRFRVTGGGIYWTRWNEHVRAVEITDELLSLPGVYKIFQNGITFDVPELLDLEFDPVGPYIDTMHLMHGAQPEMPKGLQFLATYMLEAGVWKTLVDMDDEEEGKA